MRSLFYLLMNFWPPMFGAGIRIKSVSADFSAIKVEMNLRLWNRNYVGTHFGGSLYSMTDPFYMLMLMEKLGKNYVVWDKAAIVKFKKPGRGKVYAEFELTGDQVNEIRAQADVQHKVEPKFMVYVKDSAGDVVAEIEKTLYVRRKER